MPKATMHEYYRMEARENDIRFARQVADMKAKPETLTVQQAADQDFGLRVATPNAGHHPATGSSIDYISH